MTCFLLNVYSKVQEERNDLKMKMLTKQEVELKKIGKFSGYAYCKNDKACFKKYKDMAK